MNKFSKSFLALAVVIGIVGGWNYKAIADSISTSGTRVIENPISDGNFIIRTNDGGVKTDTLTVTGSTSSLVLGPVSSTASNQHEIRGALLVDTRDANELTSIGSAGTGYGGIAWNATPNTSANSYARVVTGPVSVLKLESGGFEFHGFASAAPGNVTTNATSNLFTLPQTGGATFTSPSGTTDVVQNSSSAVADNGAFGFLSSDAGSSRSAIGVFNSPNVGTSCGYIMLKSTAGATQYIWLNGTTIYTGTTAANICTSTGTPL